MRQNIVLKRNFILDDEDMNQILRVLNDSLLNVQESDKKNTVSFYDDDSICYFVLSMPEYGDFDNDLLDVIDYLGAFCGVTACKVNGEWL